jgi:hypothetical protein
MTRKLILLAVVLTAVMLTGVPCCARAAQEGVRTVAAAEPQVKDDLFAGTEKFAQGATDVTDINLDPEMLGMVSGKKSGGLADKMNFIVVHSYHYPKPGMYKMEDVEPYRQKLRAGNWNCFIHVSESKTGESTDICRQPAPNNQGNEMVIITVEPMELTFVHISGNGSLADLGKLGALSGLAKSNKNGQSTPPPLAPK